MGPRVRGDDICECVTLPRLLRWLAAAVAGRLIGDPRVIRAIGQAGQPLAAAEEEFRTGGIAAWPVGGAPLQIPSCQPAARPIPPSLCGWSPAPLPPPPNRPHR